MAEPNTRLPSRVEITADQLGTTVPIPVASGAGAHLVQVASPGSRVELLARLAPDLPWVPFAEFEGSASTETPPWPELAAKVLGPGAAPVAVTAISI